MPDSNTASLVAEQLNAPEPVVTPSGEDGIQPAASPAAPATPAPFLTVNDRTKYNSADDAIKGFTELQGRVTSLSAWEQKIAAPIEKGGFGITDPAQVAALLDELADIRAKANQQVTPASSASSVASTVQKAAAGDKTAYDSLSPEWKAHVDYLKGLGLFVTNDALKPLQDQVSSLTAAQDAAYAQEVNNAVSHGTSILEGVMKETGITVTPELLEKVGNAVGARIDRDSYDQQGRIVSGSLADQFLRGSESDRRSIITEQFTLFKEFGEAFSTAKTASYVQNKNTAQASQPRTLPAGSGPASTPRTGRMTEDQRKAALGELLVTGGMK